MSQADTPDPSTLDPHPSQDGADEALDLANRSFEAALNLDWPLSRQLSEQAAAKGALLQDEGGNVITGMIDCLIAVTEGFAIPLRDNDPGRHQRALDALEAARQRIESLRRDFPEETALPGFKTFADSIELQILWTSRGLAREIGDEQRVLTIEAQTRVLVEGLPPEMSTMFRALLDFPRILGQVKESMVALNSMDLPRALRSLTEVREAAGAQLATIRQGLLHNVVFQASEQVMTAAYELCEVLETYVRALHDAVVGDVTRAHVHELEEAEHRLPAITESMVQGMSVLGRSSETDVPELRSSLQGTATLIRNLRLLCQESLKPKSWFATASFKFVLVFLGASIPLVALLAATNIGEGISGGALTGYVLLVSLVVALIGGFGFEALRFTPLLSVLSKSMPAQEASSGASN